MKNSVYILAIGCLISLTGCGGGSSSTPPANTLANIAPIANAGPNQAVVVNSTATLDGSASTDPDGNPITYLWSFTSKPVGSVAVLSSTTTVNPTFVADRAGNYVLSLVVNDGSLNSPPVNITVSANSPPIANAGPNQAVVVNSTATLDGSASTDPDGNPITYLWSFTSKPVGSVAVLSTTTTVNPTFVADRAGNYILSLVVNDGSLNSLAASITVSANTPPVANAGPNQAIAVNSTATLDGSASTDPDGNPITYLWSFTSKPVGSVAVLSTTTTVNPTFIADILGDYTLSLLVNDGQTNSTTSTVIITAATPVGGILAANTSWALASSPYLITSNVQIAFGTTLTINPNVRVIGNNLNIKVFGVLDAVGTNLGAITFDNVNIVPGNGPIAEWFNININYANFNSGSIYLATGNAIYGSIRLRNSILTNIRYMYLWYPVADCFIEKNVFINSGGISVGHSGIIKVSIRNNAFFQSTGDNGTVYAVENWASYGTSQTIVSGNSFLSTNQIALMLPAGYTQANMTATSNYWSTVDTLVIDSMIFDKNDDLASANFITYVPFLLVADPNTPDATPYLP